MNNILRSYFTRGHGHDWATYLRLLRYVRPYSWRLMAGIGFGLLYVAANGALVWAIKGGMREVFNPKEASLSLVFFVAIVVFPAISLVRGAADYFSTYCIKWVGNRVVMDLRNKIFEHLHGLSIGYFSQSRTGELISRTTNDSMLIERAVSTVVSDLIKEPLTLICMATMIFFIEARLAVVSLVLFPLCVVPIAMFGRKVRRYSKRAQETIADFVSILQETISGVRIVQLFGMEQYEMNRFSTETGAFFRRLMGVAKASAIVEPIIVLLATLGAAFLLVYVRIVRMEVGDFFGFTAALFMMYAPVRKLSKIHMVIQQSSAAADRIFELLDTRSEIEDRAGSRSFSGKIDDVSYEKVDFSYPGSGRCVLKNINLRVKSGERIALVGSSGSGKTTLVNLIPRFYDVTNGSIAINGVDVRDVTIKSLRRQIGMVTQDVFLFNDTIARNISYGSREASMESIMEAAKRAHAHDFITKEMPKGYETIIGERGVRMSGGQRQRIAIARAILRNPPILILDEATSALDTESERTVQSALNEAMENRTVFAIAHRLSTIMNCDRIIVLDEGQIVEEGTHDELLALCGIYKRLYDLQFDKG